jgi:hypothetical protein
MTETAHARGAAPSVAVISLDETIAEKNSVNPGNGQVNHPILLSMLRARPEPKPDVTAHDERRWRADHRRQTAERWLRHIPPHPTAVAMLIGVTPRAVQYWRRGERAPTVKHWQKLRALHGLCHQDMWAPPWGTGLAGRASASASGRA